MTQRLGGLLSLTLGTVLVTGGAFGTGQASGGTPLPTCGGSSTVGNVQPCPTSTLSVTKIVTGNGPGAPVGGWTVTLSSSNCTVPGGSPALVFTVQSGATKTISELYETTGFSESPNCLYSLVETAVPGYTGTFSTSGPYDFSHGPIMVDLTNVGVTVTPSATPSVAPTPTPTPSATPTATPVPVVTPTVAPTPSAMPTPSPAVTPVAAGGGNGSGNGSGNGGGGSLPFTGVRHLGLQVLTGGALVLLGLFLLFAGRRTRRT